MIEFGPVPRQAVTKQTFWAERALSHFVASYFS